MFEARPASLWEDDSKTGLFREASQPLLEAPQPSQLPRAPASGPLLSQHWLEPLALPTLQPGVGASRSLSQQSPRCMLRPPVLHPGGLCPFPMPPRASASALHLPGTGGGKGGTTCYAGA